MSIVVAFLDLFARILELPSRAGVEMRIDAPQLRLPSAALRHALAPTPLPCGIQGCVATASLVGSGLSRGVTAKKGCHFTAAVVPRPEACVRVRGDTLPEAIWCRRRVAPLAPMHDRR